ncbi:MAG: NDP-sugar synthase [Firmicutes bacterium]|nr:NDP-sugar synthase [Bacillota bacterium]
MKAMILAAGEGTRLYPLTYTLPKPMVPVINRPVMEHIILHLAKHGFDEIIVNLHFLPEHIENYFHDGSRLGVKIIYSHEMKPLGTAGGVKNVEDLFDDTFMVVGGDDLSDINLTEVLEFHKKSHSLATIALSRVEDVSSYGVVVTDEKGKIIEFQEKPSKEEAKSEWVNTGVYFFEPAILDLIPKGEFYDFGRQLFPKLKDDKSPFYGFRTKGYWKDVGNLNEYRQTQLDCLGEKVKINFPGKEIQPGVWVEEGCKIADNVKFIPPVVIGKNCHIGNGATLEGPLVIGKFNVIEDYAKVTRSIMWNYNNLKKGSVLEDCLTGSECIIEEEMVYEGTVIGSGMKNIYENYFQKTKVKS